MSYEPHMEELLRRLRIADPDAARTEAGDGVTWTEDQVGQVVLITSEDELAHTIGQADEDTRDALWPDSTVEAAGFNLLLVHIDEVLGTRFHEGRLRITADGLVWPDQHLPNGLEGLQLSDGPFYWTTASGESLPENDQ